MDPLTHAASGAALMLAIPCRPLTKLAAPLAALVCASPDIDLAFIHTPLEFLLIHRGITHSLAFMPFFAIPLALLCYPLWARKTPSRWGLVKVWLLCCALILLHIWLDIFTTYGTMIFLPFSQMRVRLNSIYMIDFLITLPLLYAILFRGKKIRAQIAVLVWITLWPSFGFALNCLHTQNLKNNLSSEQARVTELHVLPDMFAPFFWRAIYRIENPKPTVAALGLDWLGKPRTEPQIFPAADNLAVERLKMTSWAGDVYFNFAMLPVMEDLPERYLPERKNENSAYRLFYDLRFGSEIDWIKKILAMRPNADLPFLFMAEFAPETGAFPGKIEAIRLRFSDSGRDSWWHAPIPPLNPTPLRWLMGIR